MSRGHGIVVLPGAGGGPDGNGAHGHMPASLDARLQQRFMEKPWMLGQLYVDYSYALKSVSFQLWARFKYLSVVCTCVRVCVCVRARACMCMYVCTCVYGGGEGA
eukprot:823000-Pelagomonas_calceolata.AAC.3